jgi:hypothetical protein
VKDHWALGYVEEVLNGRTYAPNGFSPHQAWSETNILHPTITGLVGWAPNAPEGSAALSPQPPVHWDTLSARNLTVGDTKIQMTMERSETATQYHLTRQEGPPVEVNLTPFFPKGTILQAVTQNGTSVEVSDGRTRGRLAKPVPVAVQNDATVTFQHTGGVGMVPVTPDPSPGDRSQGYRVVSTSLDGSTYTASLEGQAGTTHTFQVRLFDQSIAAAEGAEVLFTSKQGVTDLRVSFDAATSRYADATVTLQLTSPPASQ